MCRRRETCDLFESPAVCLAVCARLVQSTYPATGAPVVQQTPTPAANTAASTYNGGVDQYAGCAAAHTQPTLP